MKAGRKWVRVEGLLMGWELHYERNGADKMAAPFQNGSAITEKNQAFRPHPGLARLDRAFQ